MPKLRSNLKSAAGRGKPPRSSPAAAPGTPVILCPGTYVESRTRSSDAKKAATDKAAGKQLAGLTFTPPTAEAPANDAARFAAMKLETAAAEENAGTSGSAPRTGGVKDLRQTLQNMREAATVGLTNCKIRLI